MKNTRFPKISPLFKHRALDRNTFFYESNNLSLENPDKDINSGYCQKKAIFSSMYKLQLLTSGDKSVFINKVKNIIVQHLDDEHFGVQELSEALFLSRSQVYRKIFTRTHLSPNELIRLVRISEAAMLLQQNYFNVTEVAYRVGFSNPAYFIKNFKKIFCETPKQYQKKFE